MADKSAIFEVQPLMLNYIGLLQATKAGPAAAPAQQPAAPASPTASASDLQILISSIPTAHDGQVITADFHNALRLALVSIANRMGLGPVSDEIVVTVAPRLASVGANIWEAQYGQAVQPASAATGTMKGWMQLDIPDGGRIKKIVVFASATVASGGKLAIQLVRQQVVDASKQVVLVDVAVPTGADLTKGIDGEVTLPEIGGVKAIEESRIVDNRQFKYLLTAEIADLTKVTAARITAVQILLGL